MTLHAAASPRTPTRSANPRRAPSVVGALRGTLSRALAATVLCGLLARTAVAGEDPTALWRAAMDGDLERVRAVLDAGTPPDSAHAGRYSPLMFAAQYGRLAVVRLLLERGADPNHVDHNRDTPLEWAAYGGHVDCVRALLAGGARPDPRNRGEATPLFTASRYGRAEVVRALLVAGADPAARDQTGGTALREAALSGDVATVDLLLTHGAEPGTQERILREAPLHIAATYGTDEVVKRLLAARAPVDPLDHQGFSPLARAAQQGHAAVVATLLAAGADPARRTTAGDTPFVLAAEGRVHAPRGDALAVEALLVDLTPDLAAALVAVCRAGHLEMARRLLARGADANGVDRAGNGPLAAAARRGDVATLDALLAAGADVARQGGAALHAGAAHPAVIDRLVGLGVAVDVRDARGATPLLAAAAEASLAGVRTLLARGADPNATDTEGLGIARYAARPGEFARATLAADAMKRSATPDLAARRARLVELDALRDAIVRLVADATK